jgi:hypothetical protein
MIQRGVARTFRTPWSGQEMPGGDTGLLHRIRRSTGRQASLLTPRSVDAAPPPDLLPRKLPRVLILRERVPMGASRYLKTPKVFGFHGVYRRLATHLGLVDDELTLNEYGRRLARIWATEQGYPDLVDGVLVGGVPGKPGRRAGPCRTPPRAGPSSSRPTT